MRTGVYIPDELLIAAGTRYHELTGEAFKMSELIQAGLRLLADEKVPRARVRAARPQLTNSTQSVNVPGLITKASSGS